MSLRPRSPARLAVLAVGAAALLVAARLVGPLLAPQPRAGLGVALAVLVPGVALAGWLRLDRRLGPVPMVGLLPVLGVAAWAAPLVVSLTVQLPFWVASVAVAVVTVLAAWERLPDAPPAGDLVALAGLAAVTAVFAAQWQSILIGDGLYHAGVVRKLVALDGISWSAVWPFLDATPHAGYAVPLLHAAQAGAVQAAGGDPSTQYTNMVPAFAVFVPASAYALGWALQGRAVAVVAALLAVWAPLTGDQSLSVVQQPRYYVTLIALPALWLLLTSAPQDAVVSWLVVAVFVLIALLHSTYVIPAFVTAVAIAVVRPETRRAVATGAAAAAVVIGVTYLVTLYGVARPTPPTIPGKNFFIVDRHRLALSGDLVFHQRAELLIALVAMAWLAARRPAAPIGRLAFAGAAEYLLITIPGLVKALSLVLGQGQAVRFWEMVPWPYLLAWAVVALARRPLLAVLVAAPLTLLVKGSSLLEGHSATVVALAGCALLLVAVPAGVARRRRAVPPRPWRSPGPAAVAVVTLAVMAGALHAGGREVVDLVRTGRPQPTVTDRPTPAALAFLRSGDRPLSVVLAPYRANRANWYAGLSYELVGEAGAYTVAMSDYHTQADPKDHPDARRAAVDRFLRAATPAAVRDRILDRYRVRYVVVEPRRSPALVRALGRDPRLRLVFRDRRPPPGYAGLAIWRVAPTA